MPENPNNAGSSVRRARILAPGMILALTAAVFVGSGAGVGGYTFVYAKGGSYLTNDPAACANCHVMRDYYDAWSKGPHHHVATCNDCHTPPGFVAKYWTKARNGYHHSLAFTRGGFHEPIQITPANADVLELACRHCHAEVVSSLEAHADIEPISCVRCHADVGHLE